jgi:2-octaprenyl-6-methoxyphenol hydroxylase
MTETCDILIAGGGIAGLSAAAAFGASGLRVICVDPTPPVTQAEAEGADLRTTAILQPGRDLLDRCGVWALLSDHAAPLQVMRIVDAGGETPEPRVVREFNAVDVSDLPFGWNLPNWLLRRELLARFDAVDTVSFRPGVRATDFLAREAEALVRLDDGTRVRARLVVAADGRNSAMREAADIPVRTTRYGQKALAFAVTHPIPHDDVSTEIHRSGGPFTLVPLPDRDGVPCSAIVWMEDGPTAQALADMPVPAFEAAMSDRSCHLFGPLTLVTRRTIWPIISQRAERMSGRRIALMAEAAHVVPPIGAQGLNMSLADLRALLDLAEARPEGLGDAQMMADYHDARHRDVAMRVTGIDMLNRTSQAANQALRDARARGIETLYSMAPVRRTLMKMGLGVV